MRIFTNRPGVVFDEEDTKRLFAEDINFIIAGLADLSARVAILEDLTLPPPSVILSDDFDDNSINYSLWWEGHGVNIVEQNERLELSSTDSLASYTMFTYLTHSISGRMLSVEVLSAGDFDVPGYFAYPLIYQLNPSNIVRFELSEGNLIFRIIEGGSSREAASAIPYNETFHRFLRIRTVGGNVFFEGSSFGTSWQVLASDSVGFSLGGGLLGFTVGNSQAGQAASHLLLDNFLLIEPA